MEATKARQEYANRINIIYSRREEILGNFFKSIGIDSSSAMEWKKVLALVIPADGFVCQTTALNYIKIAKSLIGFSYFFFF